MSLISPADQERLKTTFAEMPRAVRLLFFTQTLGCDTCLQARQIPGVDVQVYPVLDGLGLGDPVDPDRVLGRRPGQQPLAVSLGLPGAAEYGRPERAKPRRVLHEEREDGKLFFPPELVPVAGHPLVAARGAAAVDRVLLQRLHVYLDFTAELEQMSINPVTQRISRFATQEGTLRVTSLSRRRTRYPATKS